MGSAAPASLGSGAQRTFPPGSRCTSSCRVQSVMLTVCWLYVGDPGLCSHVSGPPLCFWSDIDAGLIFMPVFVLLGDALTPLVTNTGRVSPTPGALQLSQDSNSKSSTGVASEADITAASAAVSDQLFRFSLPPMSRIVPLSSYLPHLCYLPLVLSYCYHLLKCFLAFYLFIFYGPTCISTYLLTI